MLINLVFLQQIRAEDGSSGADEIKSVYFHEELGQNLQLSNCVEILNAVDNKLVVEIIEESLFHFGSIFGYLH